MKEGRAASVVTALLDNNGNLATHCELPSAALSSGRTSSTQLGSNPR